ncbi:MAG: RNA-binding protein [Pseudomonadota bacterium]
MQQVGFDAGETDGGKPKACPARTCIATRQVKPIEDMIRFVAAPDGTLTPDLKHNLPGRGVWVTADRISLTRALKTKAFSQSLKTDVKAGPELADQVGMLLKERALQSLSFANKAGNVVCGATKIEKALSGKPIALFHAVEGSADGIAKLNRPFHAAAGLQALVSAFFCNADLDMALGRSNVIHALLVQGEAASACLASVQKAEAYEAGAAVVNDVA